VSRRPPGMCPATRPLQGVSTRKATFLADSHHTLGAPFFASCEIDIQTRLTVDAKGGQQRLSSLIVLSGAFRCGSAASASRRKTSTTSPCLHNAGAKTTYLTAERPHLIRPPESQYTFKTYTCSFSVGYLLLQVIAARWTKPEVAQQLDFPPIFQGEFFNSYSTSLWPNDGFCVEWPPMRAINNTLFERFWDRFETFRLPPWMQ
jgi:hypothetical protein